MYLEVKPQMFRIVALQSVDAEIVASIDGVLGIDQWQGDEGTPIFWPTGDDGQGIQIELRILHLQDRTGTPLSHANLEQGPGDISRSPHLGETRRNHRLGEMD
jgi:hypothetical protein